MCKTSPQKATRVNDSLKIATNGSIEISKEDVEYAKKPASTRNVIHDDNMFYITFLAYLLPLLAYKFTNVIPLFLTGTLRLVFARMYLSLHFIFVDKDNYNNKISQTQMLRERNHYAIGIIIHMYAQIVLQVLFPRMFFVSDSLFISSCINTLLAHVFVVEPLYYAVHRWLHVPVNMKAMHGFHHSSINTVPLTSLVQDFTEHFVYVATFGPAMLLPFFLAGYQHWGAIMGYLILFDAANAYGHTNIKCTSWVWTHSLSPFRYLFYTPEFHLGHHNLFNYNFGLFMPIWDHLFGTYRDYRKPERMNLPSKQQDFIFIGHNAGLGHILTIPELSFYSMYDQYKTGLPMKLEFLIAHVLTQMTRLFTSAYNVSRYIVGGKYIGRIVCIMCSPVDYMTPSAYDKINNDILELIRREYSTKNTRYFGLGNLNKMKQLNDGGVKITEMIEKDAYLCDKNIRVWTGDTLTAASVYQQALALPNLKKLFYIGGNGKIGVAVIQALVKKNIQICIYSRYEGINHPNVKYTYDLNDMLEYDYVLIGKHTKRSLFEKVFKKVTRPTYLLDYCVPFLCMTKDAPISTTTTNSTSSTDDSVMSKPMKGSQLVSHIQIGVMKVTNDSFLKGYYDVCMGVDQSYIYPCHMGCILNTAAQKETNEVGDIDLVAMDEMWERANKNGIINKEIIF